MRPKEYERKIYGGHRYNPPIGKKVTTGAKIIFHHVSTKQNTLYFMTYNGDDIIV